jgi:FMN-dependent NADH-azoreductase
MAVLFHLDSSPMGEQSVSRRLTGEFARLWLEANCRGQVIYRDVSGTHIPPVNAEWVAANYTPEESRTPEQHRILALSTELSQELLDADEYVLGTPVHNWGSTSGLKLWADQIIRFGRTMRITRSGLKGMLGGKRLTALMTAGRRYGYGYEEPSKNHLGPWLRTFFGDLGIRDMNLVLVDGTAAIRRGEITAAEFLASRMGSVRSLFAGDAVTQADA